MVRQAHHDRLEPFALSLPKDASSFFPLFSFQGRELPTLGDDGNDQKQDGSD
jgi:hypothetical protein